MLACFYCQLLINAVIAVAICCGSLGIVHLQTIAITAGQERESIFCLHC